MPKIIIPRVISPNERCLRLLFYPFGYKNKIRKEAFMPPVDSTDISIHRLDYTTLERCKELGYKIHEERQKKQLSMPGIPLSEFVGMAIILASLIEEANKYAEDEGIDIKAMIAYGPMHNNEYILDRDVYVDDPDIDMPMHADIRYNKVCEKGEVQTQMRKYAKFLADHIETLHLIQSSR